MPTDVLLVGVSTRAAAESAARAGFGVTTIDAFADLDQHPTVRALACTRDFGLPFSARSLARAARSCASAAVAYLSPVENDPRAIATLARGRMLWGNRPETLARVRDPIILRDVLRRCNLATPEACIGAPTGVTDGRRWLVKPLASGGGAAVRVWRARSRVGRSAYLQESIDGPVGSIVFVAAGRRAVPIGLSRQLVGDPAFGATGFRYCGSILAAAGDSQFRNDRALFDGAQSTAVAIADEFDLSGVNGVDFVARDGMPYVIEVNPRWSSSMEVVERAYGINVFSLHSRACSDGVLPAFDLASARHAAAATGRAVVYARTDLAVGDTGRWLDDPDVRDVPRSGERILTGRPICSIFATGADSQSCYAALVARAMQIYAEVAVWSC